MNVGRLSVAVAGLLVFSAESAAELEEIRVEGSASVTRPRLLVPAGWHNDEGASIQFRLNALAPDGYTYVEAPYAIAAVALQIEDDTSTVTKHIEFMRNIYLETDLVTGVEDGPSVITAGGKALRCLVVTSEGTEWKRQCYGQEGQYNLVFTVISLSEADFGAANTAFNQLMEHFAHEP